ncbi:MAG: bifunctional demethylmenaquinone methyltransferase/2-methoxy-6-polyprenyl-1,4-benzoquinol methylase UbiE [Prolixibacteraceae bacterium]|nr:bifunctional demethylmenaquinone methyltransferase/2-methoxy-6-polyprenyl-1,4-benzoquinol methylase UbiE [Prolixibacteraceae bacterium]
MPAKPYKKSELSKKRQVEDMFDRISYRYDLLNHLLSFNIDKLWRRNAINRLAEFNPATIIDIATGTADFALAATRLNPKKITGIDLSEGMLEIGRQKVKRRGFSHLITLIKGDSEELPFADNLFDAAIVGFGVRNFENLEKGLSEIFRILNPGGVFIVLEFSYPHNKLFRKLYFFYFTKVLPVIGRILSKDSSAYSYLPESVAEFPEGERFMDALRRTGYFNCRCYPQTFGIASVYLSQKPKI